MTLRSLTQVIVGLVIIAALALLILATDKLLTLWERLQGIGPWAPYFFMGLMLAFAAAGGWLLFRLIAGAPSPAKAATRVTDAPSLARRIALDESRGVATAEAQRELDTLNQRKQTDKIYLTFFGAASSGKSSLVQALLPAHRLSQGVLAGTTRAITHYAGERRGREIELADVPGFGHEPTAALIVAARDEAIRAHIVIYVTDGDLDRRQYSEITALTAYAKPIIVALNKTDRYQPQEIQQLRNRLTEVCGEQVQALVAVSAGGEEEVIVADGASEVTERRPRAPDVADLWRAVDKLLTRADLALRAEHSSLQLASEKLAAAESAHRRERGEQLTQKYARRAVIGAMAALTPGSDLVIQAALATRFLRELGQLYEINVREIEIEQFLTLAGDRLKRTTALVLAVTGNAFKAFPGLGTLAGGVVHAAAYGMIFDSIGRSVCTTLEAKKTLDPLWAAAQFEQRLSDKSAPRASDFARLALAELTRKGDES